MVSPIRTGAFVPTTNVWDVSQIYNIDVTSPQFKELLIRLYQNINNIALTLNTKDTGYYLTDSLVNSQMFFPNPIYNSSTAENPGYRQVLRIVIDFGALPNTGTKSMPHNITINSATTFTRIYGTASDTTNLEYIPLPYSSASGTSNIELFVDSTNVNIITASNRSTFTTTYIVLEYIVN
jgi:hypothetical protein